MRDYLAFNNSYHLFGIAETRLGPEVNDNFINIPGYSVLRQDRNIRGGGILLYVKENLKAKVLFSSTTEQRGKPLKPEYIFCSVWEGNSIPTLVVLVYRPPDVSIRSDRRFIEKLHNISMDFSHKIVLGDWNADLLAKNNSDTRFLKTLMSDLSLKLVRTGPTHHTNEKDTWIDSIFVDNCDTILSFERKLPDFSSRHDIISVTIDIFNPSMPIGSYTYKCLNKITASDLNLQLCNLDWSVYSMPKDNFDIELGLSTLTNNIQTTIDTLAPDKIMTVRKNNYPWMNTELRLIKSKRDATKRRYDRTGSRPLLNEFLSLAKSYEEQSEMARTAYMHSRICGTLDANKNFWKEMRKLGMIPEVSDALHGFLPEELNSHFSNISISPNEDPEVSLNIINNATTNGFALKKVSQNDVILAVSHFSSQAKGEDGIPQSIIAKALPILAPYLTKLFNASLAKGIFPSAWKKSQIIALKKVSVPSSPSDFRPIALLCFLSKVLEKLVHDQVTSFLNKSKILDLYQTGFRKFHSTQSALIKLTDDIRMGKDKRLATLLLQFDFSKAFDNVSPSKLLQKLKDIGFSKSSLIWFWSYLSCRSLCVSSKTSTSAPRDINIGVPQGSVLGPLLFCVYMNDLKEFLQDDSIFRLLYADDLQIYLQVPVHELQQGIFKLSNSAIKVATWAVNNSLALNTSKTKAIVFGSSATQRSFKKLNLPSIIVNDSGTSVPFVNEVLSLGVLLDSTLSWKPQIQLINKKVNRTLYGLKVIRPCTSESLRIRLVESLVIPHLDYCSVVYSDISCWLSRKLQRLTNACIRYIYGLRCDEHITPYRRKLHWMRNATRTDYFASLIMYRLIRMKEPPFLLPLFNPYQTSRPNRGPRKDLDIPAVSTDWGLRSFQVKYANFWNSIPPCIRDIHSYSRFKKSIKNYLYKLDVA